MPVDDSPLTRASLLVQLRDGGNHAAWQEFAKLYGPVIYGFAQAWAAGRRRGRPDARRHAFGLQSNCSARLQSQPGNFPRLVVHDHAQQSLQFFLGARVHPQASGDTTTNRLLDTQPDHSDGADAWETEYQRRLAALAMERVKSEFQENTWRAFWLTAVEGIAVADVARQISISPGAIYVAKSRVLARLKEEVEAMRRQEES